jgi:hypothetical protein
MDDGHVSPIAEFTLCHTIGNDANSPLRHFGHVSERSFRVFGIAARPQALPPANRPPGLGFSFRACGLLRYRAMGSAIPPCRRPFPRLRGVPATGFAGHSQVADRTLSSSFAILWSFSQQDLAAPPKRASPSHGLSLPTAHSGFADPLTRTLPARYVPPSGFGHPLDGLLPANPRRLYFTPTALLGFPLRSLLLSKGIPALPPGGAHVPFLPPLFPPPKRRGGPAGRGFWVLTLPRVPRGLNVCLARQPPDAPLGFALLGPANRNLGRDFAPPPLTCFATGTTHAPTAGTPESQSASV